MAAISAAQIVKEALGEIKARQLMLTPENYAEVYNEISTKYGFTTEEKRKIERYISRLSSEFRTQANSVNINSVDEFIAFLIARLNRTSQNNTSIDDDKNFKSLNAFTRRILQAIAMLHNKDAKNLAESSVVLLNKKFEIAKFDEMRERWFDLISDYNDEYLEFLKYYGVRNFDDLKTMMSELDKFLTIQSEKSPFSQVSELVINMLKPSISGQIDTEIDELGKKIKLNPVGLATADMQDEIKRMVAKRIEADRDEIMQKVSTLNDALASIDSKIADIATASLENSQKAHDIKSDIKEIKFDAVSLEQIKGMLLNIATALEMQGRDFVSEMDHKQATISDLQQRVGMLEKELKAAKAESNEDFLTKTATKRALMAELGKIEDAYKRYGIDYSLCFLDIDHFKKINDTYGHDAGDAILSTVSAIFRKYSRSLDFVGRYGGEEFVIILPGINLDNAVKFSDKIRQIIQNFKFIYKDERINVTISVGVATRSLGESETNTLESADKMLYAAKNNGRNQVMPQII